MDITRWSILKSVQFTQSCPTLCDPMDCSLPGFPVHHPLLELTQTSDFGIDPLVMSMCRSSLVLLEEGVCYDQCIFLAKLYQPVPCFIPYSKAKFACYSRCFLTSYFCIPVPYNEKDIFFGVSSKRSCRSSQNCSTSASSALLVGSQAWITVILNGLPWK